jgi:hypothetical protein
MAIQNDGKSECMGEAIYSVQIRRCFNPDLWPVGSRATAGVENDPGIRQLDQRCAHMSGKPVQHCHESSRARTRLLGDCDHVPLG